MHSPEYHPPYASTEPRHPIERRLSKFDEPFPSSNHQLLSFPVVITCGCFPSVHFRRCDDLGFQFSVVVPEHRSNSRIVAVDPESSTSRYDEFVVAASGRSLSCWDRPQAVTLMDVLKRTKVGILYPPRGGPSGILGLRYLNPSSAAFDIPRIVGSNDRSLFVYDAHNYELLLDAEDRPTSATTRLECVPKWGCEHGFVAGGDGMLWRYELERGRKMCQYDGHSAGVSDLAVCRKRRILFSCVREGDLRLWSVDRDSCIHTSSEFGGCSLAYSEDTQILAQGLRHGIVVFRDLRWMDEVLNKIELPLLPAFGYLQRGDCFGVSFSDDGRECFVVSQEDLHVIDGNGTVRRSKKILGVGLDLLVISADLQEDENTEYEGRLALSVGSLRCRVSLYDLVLLSSRSLMCLSEVVEEW